MDRQAILRLPWRIIRRSRRMAGGLLRRLKPRQKKMVFVFGGRTHHWPGMGRTLYANEPVFRATVQQCDGIIRELAGVSVLANFEGTIPEDFFETEDRVILSITVVQLALVELWKSKGVYPNAVMGVSLGEVTAVYAAGGLSLKDALIVICGFTLATRSEKPEFVVLYIQASLADAFGLAQSAPVWMEPIYETSPQTALVFCHENDRAEATRYFTSRNIACHAPHEDRAVAYHTSRMLRHRQLLLDLQGAAQPQPFLCPFYSCTLGGVLPTGALLETSFWQELSASPVLTHSAMQAAGRDGYEIYVHVSPHPFLKGQLQGAVSPFVPKPLILDSMDEQEPEPDCFSATQRILSKLRLAPSTLDPRHRPPHWVEGFRFYQSHVSRNPYPYFRHLQASGPVHYLPAENAWLVLDYDTIDEVLKQPSIFSSTIHQSFDTLLLGADPPAHTTMRTLLQPLFAPQVLSQLGAYTEQEAERLLNSLAQQDSFDMVSQFSLPLAKSVIAHFLGLSSEEASKLEACLEGPVYGLGYLPQLEQFCHAHLQSAATRTGAVGLLLDLVDNGQLQFDDAVRLLRMLWIAGMTTTSMLLSQSVYQLLMHPHLAPSLQEDTTLIHKFIEECLRLEAPESELRRITTQATTLGGKNLPQGAIVLLGLRAANRDPLQFDRPDSIVLDRPVKRHLSFGGGYHYCLGVGMARVEARQALRSVLAHLPQLKLDLHTPASYFPSPHFRGLAQLKVRNASIKTTNTAT